MPARRIGLLLDQRTSHGRAIAQGIRNKLLPRTDRELIIGAPNEAGFAELAAQRPDGIIAHIANEAFSENLKAFDKPLINCSNAIETSFPRVGVDEQALGARAAEHLLEGQHKHFAFVGRSVTAYSRERYAGFSAALSAAGHNCANCEWNEQDGNRALIQQLRALPKPLAVLVIGDELALRLIALCQEAGMGVPDPVAIMSATNNDDVCTLSRPGITAIDAKRESVGASCVAKLEQLLAGETVEPVTLLPPGALIQRESASPAAIDDPALAAAVAFIAEHSAENLGVDDVAKAADIGRRSLERRFSAYFSHSIYNHIVRTRLDRAKALLANGDTALASIAEQIGFASAQHLCDVFKRKIGVTPGAWRELHRREQ